MTSLPKWRLEELGFELKCVAPKANGTLPPGGRNDGDSDECAEAPVMALDSGLSSPALQEPPAHTRRHPSLSPSVFITSLFSLAPSFSSLLDLSESDAREGEEQ